MAESVSSLTTQLAAIDAAIATAEAAASQGADGVSHTSADLSTLYARRDVVQRRLEQAQAIAADSGGSKLFGRTRVLGIGEDP